MPETKPLVLGDRAHLRAGDVTTLDAIAANSAPALERSLGFGPGRLAEGWWVLLLKEPIAAADFIFAGTTLRSGGRLGLPTDDPATDPLRTHVQARMITEYGAAEVQAMREREAKRVPLVGPRRLAKIVPVIEYSETMAPSRQFPMGLGARLQWTLVNEKKFLVAVQVDRNGIARTPDFSVFLGVSAAYDDRAKLYRYMTEA